MAIDWLHFTSVAAWIGGLASLVYVLPVAVKASQSAGDQIRAKAVARFSQMALVAVGAIILTGTFQAWLEVGSWEGFVQTGYGVSVAVKIGLLALILLLAAFNLLVARPGWRRRLALARWPHRRRWSDGLGSRFGVRLVWLSWSCWSPRCSLAFLQRAKSSLDGLEAIFRAARSTDRSTPAD